MKILMLAPEPFFTVRGTPFSILNRLQALSELGHEVDLITYHLGEDVSLPGLTICRIPRMPFIRRVKIGPSATKIPLDLVLFGAASWRCLRKRYDCVHTHEEAAVMGAVLSALFGVVHVYDMHSSLPQQFINYNYFRALSGFLLAGSRCVERFILGHSDAVIAICPQLKDIAVESGARGKIEVIENPPLVGPSNEVDPAGIQALKDELGIGKRLVALYTGTFEFNQGLEEIVQCIPRVLKEASDTAFVLVGGEKEQVESIRELGRRYGVSGSLILPGKKPMDQMELYMAASDMLLSFRKIGTNTPLKIYSYLWSGKPVVATDMLVHTQVLSREVALLTEPTVEEFSKGIIMLAGDPELRGRIGRSARLLAERRYTRKAYIEKVGELYHAVQKSPAGAAAMAIMSALLMLAFASRPGSVLHPV